MIILSMSLVSCSGGESCKNSVYINDTTSSIKTSDTGGSDLSSSNENDDQVIEKDQSKGTQKLEGLNESDILSEEDIAYSYGDCVELEGGQTISAAGTYILNKAITQPIYVADKKQNVVIVLKDSTITVD